MDDEFEELNSQLLDETGFWGRRGAGCIVFARDTGRILLQKRSGDVLQPHTWGVWGGAIDGDRTPQKSALLELREESGFQGDATMVFLVDYVDEETGFRYSNYMAVVDEEFAPVLNWEGEDFGWFDVGDWPEPLHFGLEFLLENVSLAQEVSGDYYRKNERTGGLSV
jgi:8-oxo-dGTP pyrophosphatase MutT (NUDIX family)